MKNNFCAPKNWSFSSRTQWIERKETRTIIKVKNAIQSWPLKRSVNLSFQRCKSEVTERFREENIFAVVWLRSSRHDRLSFGVGEDVPFRWRIFQLRSREFKFSYSSKCDHWFESSPHSRKQKKAKSRQRHSSHIAMVTNKEAIYACLCVADDEHSRYTDTVKILQEHKTRKKFPMSDATGSTRFFFAFPNGKRFFRFPE